MSKLLLTNYITAGKIGEAVELSRVREFPSPNIVESYSGFFTVDQKFNSNLFFWFFPAEQQPDKAPLILWLSGGPGFSSLFGAFVENGPFSVDERCKLKRRSESWTSTHSMIYMDPTVGSGFSHTDSQEGYSQNQEDVSNNLYEALTQFFLLFPKFQSRDFYVAGESYGGKFSTSLAWRIHSENKASPKVVIDLKGLIHSAAFLDPLHVFDRLGQHYYGMGLIDQNGLAYFNKKASEMRSLAEKGQFSEVFEIQDKLIGGDVYKERTYYNKVTGYDLYLSILQPTVCMEYIMYAQVLTEKSVTKALNVGNTPFIADYKPVFLHFKEDYMKSVRSTFEKLLDLNYKILTYVGQFDGIIPAFAQEEMLTNINFQDFNRAERKIWRLNSSIAGYVKQSKNLTYAVIRNAGHTSSLDRPKECLDLVTKFTQALPY